MWYRTPVSCPACSQDTPIARPAVRETVVDGIANAPEAFLALLRGDHIGKMVVRVGPDPA